MPKLKERIISKEEKLNKEFTARIKFHKEMENNINSNKDIAEIAGVPLRTYQYYFTNAGDFKFRNVRAIVNGLNFSNEEILALFGR